MEVWRMERGEKRLGFEEEFRQAAPFFNYAYCTVLPARQALDITFSSCHNMSIIGGVVRWNFLKGRKFNNHEILIIRL